MLKRVLIIGAIVLVAGLAGFGLLHRSSTPVATAQELASAVSTNQVKIADYMFVPMTVKVKPGTTVTWTNMDMVHHSVTADTISPNAPNGPLIGKGQTYSFTFKKAGVYTFHCQPHPFMHGTIIVTN